MTQPSLDFTPALQPAFDSGIDLTPADQVRLSGQIERVLAELAARGTWKTVADIAAATGDPETSVSAQLRNLRKPKHGGYDVRRERRGNGSVYKLCRGEGR